MRACEMLTYDLDINFRLVSQLSKADDRSIFIVSGDAVQQEIQTAFLIDFKSLIWFQFLINVNLILLMRGLRRLVEGIVQWAVILR